MIRVSPSEVLTNLTVLNEVQTESAISILQKSNLCSGFTQLCTQMVEPREDNLDALPIEKEA